MRFTPFNVLIMIVWAIALSGLGGWVYFAQLAKASPESTFLDLMALASILTTLFGTLFLSQWWVEYLRTDFGMSLRFYSLFSIFVATFFIASIFGVVGFPYGFSVLMSGGIALFLGIASFPDVSSGG